MNSVVTDEITRILLCMPQAAGLAGIAFAFLIGLVLALLPGVVLADLHAAGVWLAQAGLRREVQAALGLLPFRSYFLLWLMGAGTPAAPHLWPAVSWLVTLVAVGGTSVFLVVSVLVCALARRWALSARLIMAAGVAAAGYVAVARGLGDADGQVAQRTASNSETPPPICRWRPVSSAGSARATRCRPVLLVPHRGAGSA